MSNLQKPRNIWYNNKNTKINLIVSKMNIQKVLIKHHNQKYINLIISKYYKNQCFWYIKTLWLING